MSRQTYSPLESRRLTLENRLIHEASAHFCSGESRTSTFMSMIGGQWRPTRLLYSTFLFWQAISVFEWLWFIFYWEHFGLNLFAPQSHFQTLNLSFKIHHDLQFWTQRINRASKSTTDSSFGSPQFSNRIWHFTKSRAILPKHTRKIRNGYGNISG